MFFAIGNVMRFVEKVSDESFLVLYWLRVGLVYVFIRRGHLAHFLFWFSSLFRSSKPRAVFIGGLLAAVLGYSRPIFDKGWEQNKSGICA